MTRVINGQPADSPEEKKKAVESAGGQYNEFIEDYIQGDKKQSVFRQENRSQKRGQNYVEKLEGDYYQGNYIEGGNNTKIAKKEGWM